MIRILSLIGALSGAVAMSQFPEYSQQYLQRLAGAVDELRAIVVAFDDTAARSGLTRDEALADLDGSAFQSDLQATLAGQIRRYEALSADYQALRRAEPVGRLLQVFRFTDPDLARRTWGDFRPAVPATADGLLFAGMGFVGGWVLFAALSALLLRPFRRRRDPWPDRPDAVIPADPDLRREPPLSRPHPRLPGATRPTAPRLR